MSGNTHIHTFPLYHNHIHIYMISWKHLMDLREGNSLVTNYNYCPHKMPVRRNFNISVAVNNKQVVNKQSSCRWFETPWHSCDDSLVNFWNWWSHVMFVLVSWGGNRIMLECEPMLGGWMCFSTSMECRSMGNSCQTYVIWSMVERYILNIHDKLHSKIRNWESLQR